MERLRFISQLVVHATIGQGSEARSTGKQNKKMKKADYRAGKMAGGGERCESFVVVEHLKRIFFSLVFQGLLLGTTGAEGGGGGSRGKEEGRC